MAGRGQPVKAYEKLGWRAKYRMKDVVRMMVEADLKSGEMLRKHKWQ